MTANIWRSLICTSYFPTIAFVAISMHTLSHYFEYHADLMFLALALHTSTL